MVQYVYVACTGEKMKWYGLLVGTLEGKSLLGILDIDGIIITLLKLICKIVWESMYGLI